MYDTDSTPSSYSSITLSLSSSQTYVVFGIESLLVNSTVVPVVRRGDAAAVGHTEQRWLVLVVPCRGCSSTRRFSNDLLIAIGIKRVGRSASRGSGILDLVRVVVNCCCTGSALYSVALRLPAGLIEAMTQ